MIPDHKHRINNCKKSTSAEYLLVAASALSLSSACKASVFSESSPVPPYFFFNENPFYGSVF